ncbi:hypothetical protein KUTeg_018474 [Tegillarca granosa]|uniref:Potassium channel domain-containing protein n=1 Tax=Tegillarca granosa TaxID=220873 RepID=A0ABQ9EKH8_TEGGR|nr:hypothetical protein KUTeg_018474 [Tegillarca granosa]
MSLKSYGHISPKTVYGRLVCIVYAILGIPLFLTCLAVVGDALSLVFRYIYTNACCFGWCDRKHDVKTSVLKQKKYRERREVKDRSFSGDRFATRNENNKKLKMDDIVEGNTDLPLTIVVIVLLSNITAGALLFGYWENWDMMQSIYFAFVTLTTIGFGDVIPGTDFKDPMAKIQLALGGIFMLVGLAVVAMCFALIQDQIVIIARQIGKKLGIIDEKVD